MSRYWLGRAGASWTIRLALVLACVALVVGLTAATQRSRRAWSRGTFAAEKLTSVTRAQDQALEIRLDDLMAEMGDAGLRSLDRQAILDVAQRAMGTREPVETMRVADVLKRVPRVRIVTEGRSVVLGSRAIRLLARLAVGRERGAVDELTVGELLDELPPVALDEDGSPTRLDRRSARLAEAIFGSLKKVNHARAPGFAERLELEQKYERVVALVKDLKRGGLSRDADRDALYDEAYNRLQTANEEDAITLLDGHLRFEDEMDNVNLKSLSHAERIQLRWEARRSAFGEETAKLLFGRIEAMERYQVDKLALDADDFSAPDEKAKRLAQRQKELKVELAAMGSYVGFPDESAGREAVAPDDAAGGRRRAR